MHIPDGYLSPSTCAVMYAGAAPFWAVALRRLKGRLEARLAPVLALVSAFCFVIMMFNLPVWGGTTAHAVGMGIAAVIVGPAGAIVAISIALLIQAVFFGDGGITCYGANCFNMAIVGSLAAYAVYRLVAGRSAIGSVRRVAGCALGGYVGINLSALCAAVEFGIQPGLFHDAAGAPLYAPYPLSIAIPSMLAAHLSLAGIAEAVIGGALVAYLQRADPGLLELTAPRAGNGELLEAAGWEKLRPLWLGLALMMVLTPLGLLATASAWGEWGTQDLKNAAAREQIAAASGNVAPPAAVPAGLEKLSTVWTAPMPEYAPRFLKSERLGYVCSAMFGTGLIMTAWLGLGWMMRARKGRDRPLGA
jgi:cobalt/nickel transport system permease protein